MREKLIEYVNLLFAGTDNTQEIREEILQNTLDRYDDLIAQGKAPEAAYRLAISGIGDVNEILQTPLAPTTSAPVPTEEKPKEKPMWKHILQAIGIFFYIISLIPLFVLGSMDGVLQSLTGGIVDFSVLGLCATVAICAVATVLVIVGADRAGKDKKKGGRGETVDDNDPKKALYKSVNGLIDAIGLAVYFLISFATGAWHVTWVIFPLMGASKGLVRACIDLKEANNEK